VTSRREEPSSLHRRAQHCYSGRKWAPSLSYGTVRVGKGRLKGQEGTRRRRVCICMKRFAENISSLLISTQWWYFDTLTFTLHCTL
jgi:hypothetical protein